MILTKEQFRESLYYPAAGCDLNPMLRFSDLTDTFVYTNLGLTEEEVMRYIKWELYRYKGQLEMTGEARSISRDEIEFDNNTNDIFCAFNHKWEEDDFNHEFEKMMDEPFWGKEIKFNRIIGGKTRELRLIYLKEEGMTGYIGLSHRGKYVPRYLCTIQSGVLETPEGPMERIMECYDNYPDIWVRGFQYKKYYFKNSLSLSVFYSRALQSKGIYNQKVQTYGKWYTNPTWQSKNTISYKRHVAAFCREENMPKKKEEILIKAGDRTLSIKRKKIEREDFGKYDTVFTSNNLLKKTGRKFNNIILWDALYSDNNYVYPDISRMLDFADSKIEERKSENILMTLAGYEDSGEAITDWFKYKAKVKNAEIRTVNLYDLFSLMKEQNQEKGN